MIRAPALIAAVVLASATASAHHDGKYHYCGAGPSDGIEFCPWEWSLGLGAAAQRAAGSWGWALGVDLALGKKKPGWFGGGGRVERLAERTAGAVYVEAGLFVYLNLGGGVSVRFGDSTRVGPHLFLGVPVPIPPSSGWLRETRFFIEPYYRPAFLFDHAGEHTTFHEFGLLFKIWSKRTHYED